jgi:hypothetical protein
MRLRHAGGPGQLARLAVTLVLALALSAALAAPSFGAAWWHMSSRDAPTNLVPGGKATIVIAATNVGDVGVDARTSPVTISDVLPPGLEATEIRGEPAFHKEASHFMSCQLSTLTCTSKPELLPPFERIEVTINVNVKSSIGAGETNGGSVQGGEQEGTGTAVAGATTSEPLLVGDAPTPFGVEAGGYTMGAEEEGGGADGSAGSHPFQLTTDLSFNRALEEGEKTRPTQAAPALVRDLTFNLPPGVIGDPQAVAKCPAVDFYALGENDTNACKPEAAIGVAVVTVDEPLRFGDATRAVPLWNLEPAKGEPARLGFETLDVPVVLDTAIRSNGDYGVTVDVQDAPEAAQILSSEVTIWGVPGSPAHDQSRGWACLLGGVYFNGEVPCESTDQSKTNAFLTLPTACSSALNTSVEGDSWPVKGLGGETGEVFSLGALNTESTMTNGLSGCGELPFSPSIKLAAESSEGDTPTGLTVDVHVPQEGTVTGGDLAEADLDSTTVTLPPGVEVNPASANGLQACSEQQVGYEGSAGVDPYAPGTPQPLRFSNGVASCPEASKVGVVRVHTPLLENVLSGAVYLADQDANPFGSLIALYIVVEDPVSGVRVKLAGEVHLNPETGQITSTFADTPQLPFEDFELEFFGGPRASVSTPAHCGSAVTEALFTPWSGGEAKPSSSPAGEFSIVSGPAGSPCASPLPFTPSAVAGSTETQAGAFTSFSLTLQNPDGDQSLQSLSVHLPEGIAALLSTVTPCAAPAAGQEWSCGPASEIGHCTVASGLGSDPFSLPGTVYLTTGYDGAPFGILVVTPAVAGPFNLGNVDVRSKIEVNPSTAAVTITSDPFPQFVQGIPVQLKAINVTIDRPGFEFNPTSCEPSTIDTVLGGNEGASIEQQSHFQTSGCSSLPFAPTLKASVAGHASKPDGTGLTVDLTSRGLGQANIKKVDLQLPKQLPSRQSTLKEACPDTVFDANAAACLNPPYEHSVVGYATVHTPVLKSPLTGPGILVSHANAAFPDLEFVLQGEGIELVLDGQTDISHGVTYSRFESAPDAPFTTFETKLPEGLYSILGAYASAANPEELCSDKLVMPTSITSQDGTTISSETQIATTGCGGVKGYKAHKPTAAQRLAQALKKCRKKDSRRAHKRASCERGARRAARRK